MYAQCFLSFIIGVALNEFQKFVFEVAVSLDSNANLRQKRP